MASRIVGALFGAALGMGATTAFAQAPGGGDAACVSAKTDWSVCVWNEPKECWGVSKPKETVNTRGGQPVSARRGDILMFVTFRPGAGAAGEVSFTGGYPFAPGSTVSVAIDGQTYELMTDGEWAWAANQQADAALLAAMKRGASAVVTGISARETQTRDTFSLQGFTAAMTEAEARCQ